MLMLNVPATAGLVALGTPIVRLIYEHGRFTEADTAATAAALMSYAPGLIGYSAVKLMSPAFYALGNSRMPMIASAVRKTLRLAGTRDRSEASTASEKAMSVAVGIAQPRSASAEPEFTTT